MTKVEKKQSLLTDFTDILGRNISVFLKKQPEGWNVFTLVNTENKLTAELWVETECDYFEWEEWDTGFFTKREENKMLFDGQYLTDAYGEILMTTLQTSYEDLFPIFH